MREWLAAMACDIKNAFHSISGSTESVEPSVEFGRSLSLSLISRPPKLTLMEMATNVVVF